MKTYTLTTSVYSDFINSYRELSDPIFRYCYVRLSDRDKALEVVQDAFTNAWDYLSQGNHISYLKAFLYRTANNLIIDHYRKKKTLSLDKLREKGFDPFVDQQEEMQNIIEGKKAVRALSRINDKYHEALRLRYVEGLSIKEIAEIVDQTQNNVSVRIHRGLRDLRALMLYEGKGQI